MLDVEDWAEIRRLHCGEKVPIKVIARALGISKNTVRSALRSDGTPRYERAPSGSIVDEVEPRIRALLRAFPTMARCSLVVPSGVAASDPGAVRVTWLPRLLQEQPSGRVSLRRVRDSRVSGTVTSGDE